MWDFIKEVYKNDTFLSIINSILGIGVILLGAVNYLYQKIFLGSCLLEELVRIVRNMNMSKN